MNGSIKDYTENLADPQEEEGVPTSSGVVAARSKAKAKPQPRESIGTTTIPLSERKWIDIEPSKQDFASYDFSKKVINLLRHNQTLQREEDGAIQFYKVKFHLRDHHPQIQNWSNDRWLACLAAGGGSKRRYQYCSYNLRSIIYLRALQEHSGSNLIDPTIQDNVLIGPGIFLYLPCGKPFQSSFNYQQWIDTWRSEFEQKTNCVLLASWSKKWRSQRSREYWLLCTASRTIHAKCMEETSRYGILGRYWSWNQRRINVLSDKIERNYSSWNTSSPLHCKSWKIEKWKEIVWKTTCLFVHHRRSLWNPISIGVKEIITVLQLNIDQLVNSFNSHLEKHCNLVLPSQPNSLNPLHRYGKAPGCKEYHTANQLAKKCRKKKYDSIHDRYIRDKTFRKAMIEVGRSEKVIKEMDQFASENHTYKATKAGIDVYRGNWWIHSNVANFDSVPTRHQPDFKKVLSTMHRLKPAEDEK